VGNIKLKTMTLLGFRINFVFRHKFEKDRRKIDKILYWRQYNLGIWFKSYKTVSKPKDGPAVIGKNGTTSRSFLFGVDLLICKFWINICHRPYTFQINEKD
jgi:hypothetical protein